MTIAPAFTLQPTAAPAPPPAPQPAQHPQQKLDELVDKFRRLRDKKKEIADRHKAELAPYNEALEQLGAMLLDALNRAGVESSRTRAGTVFRSTRTSYTVKDPLAFREWLEANARFDLLETRLSKEAIEELIKQGSELPPGVGISSEFTVNVRK